MWTNTHHFSVTTATQQSQRTCPGIKGKLCGSFMTMLEQLMNLHKEGKGNRKRTNGKFTEVKEVRRTQRNVWKLHWLTKNWENSTWDARQLQGYSLMQYTVALILGHNSFKGIGWGCWPLAISIHRQAHPHSYIQCSFQLIRVIGFLCLFITICIQVVVCMKLLPFFILDNNYNLILSWGWSIY